MNQARKNIRKYAFAVLFMLAIVFHFIGGTTAAFGIPAAGVIAMLLLLFLRHRFPRPAYPSSESPAAEPLLPHLAHDEADASIAEVQVAALGNAFRKEHLEKTETNVDATIDACIKLVHMQINAHTVAVFFPTVGEGYRLRRHWSQSGRICPDATIRPGEGVLGGFFKDGLKTLNLKEIMSDSTTLYYYSENAGVRSLIACPIVAGNVERGIIVADSTEKNAFTDEHISFMSTVAALLGQAAYHAYLNNENWLDHMRLAEVSNIEKNFFTYRTVGSILDSMADIIPFALPCDRMTISLRSDDGENAQIRRVHGICTEKLLDARFSLSEKSLASIVYTKNLSLFRNFATDRYEVRHFEQEPHDEEFASFLAVPLGVDDCKGMILVESLRPDAFSDTLRGFLSRIATSAGLAVEKVLLLEKANAMATHDGLTGLYNHRQFQQLLKDEITRSGRYNDPLALVIGDIDFFKKVNDTHGHQFGDTVLKNVATLLDASIRTGIDTAARYGGEEFALVLVKTNERQAAETVERIRAAIERLPLKSPSGADVRVTMSFGIAALGRHTREHDDLIKKADKALYRAKECGRNRIEIF
ncbi:MAG: diguanylate cyclase [Chitinispirillaceae bacterium]|jgi:diguanylate cyclase (GGDEF)-like protein